MIVAVFLGTQDAAAVKTSPAVSSALSSSTRHEKWVIDVVYDSCIMSCKFFGVGFLFVCVVVNATQKGLLNDDCFNDSSYY